MAEMLFNPESPEILLTSKGVIGPEAEEFWQHVFPERDPPTIYEILKRGMPPCGDKERIRLYLDSSGRFRIEMDFYEGERLRLVFRFAFSDRQAELCEGYVYGNQRQSLATRMLYNVENVFTIKDTRIVNVSTEEVGSYAWLKLGFVPHSVESFRDGVLENLGRFDRVIGAQQRDYVLQLLKSSDPKVAWSIADMAELVPDMNGPPIKYGQLLMKDTNWQGRRDRNDDDCSDRFHAYCQRKLITRE